MRNTLNFKQLKQIINVINSNNVNDEDIFDYFRIAGLNNKKYENYAKNTLFFFTYVKKEDKNGWYIKAFDYRENTKSIIDNNPNFTFVIEKDQEKLINNSIKYIVVENINEAVDKLFFYFINKSKASTIAITGSVGKTTCVGLIEHILKKDYNILRIYSKRITPIILKANIINFLTQDIDYIVMEFSIFFHNHVEIFTDLLKPTIAVQITIQSSHMGIELLKTIDDICYYKSKIFKYAKYAIINNDDEYLKNLNYKNGSLYYKDRLVFENNNNLQLIKINPNDISISNNNFVLNNISFAPFMLSNLSKIQYYTAYKIAKLLNLSDESIKESFSNYIPVENRVHTEFAFGKRIIFDGDITTYERVKQLTDNYYNNKYLVLRKVGSSENTLRISNIKELFKYYNYVYIFSDVEYLKHLKDEKNVIIVDNHDFMKDIKGTIIYHYSGYFRVFNKFNENNLKIYDDIIYKVKVED